MAIFRAIFCGVFCAAVVLPVWADGQSCGPALAAKIMQYKSGDVNQFLQYGCVIDNQKWKISETPLEWAIGGYNNVQDNYIAVRAFLDAKPELANSVDYNHQHVTMLALAVRSCCNDTEAVNKPKIVEELLKHGAEVNQVLDNIKRDNGTLSHVIVMDDSNRKVTALDVVRANIADANRNSSPCHSYGITHCKTIEQTLLDYGAKTYAELNGQAEKNSVPVTTATWTPASQTQSSETTTTVNTEQIVETNVAESDGAECNLSFSTGEILTNINTAFYDVYYDKNDKCLFGDSDICANKTYPLLSNLIAVNGNRLPDNQKSVIAQANFVDFSCLPGGDYVLNAKKYVFFGEQYFTIPENTDGYELSTDSVCNLSFSNGKTFSAHSAYTGKQYDEFYRFTKNDETHVDFSSLNPKKVQSYYFTSLGDCVHNDEYNESRQDEYRADVPPLFDLVSVNGKQLTADEQKLLQYAKQVEFFCGKNNDYILYVDVLEEDVSGLKAVSGSANEEVVDNNRESVGVENTRVDIQKMQSIVYNDPAPYINANTQDFERLRLESQRAIQDIINSIGSEISSDAEQTRYRQKVALIYDNDKKIMELQKAYSQAKERETSTANRLLSGATMAATGLGGMELARGLAEQNADKDAAADMAAYMATFQCKIGDKGNKINGGDMEIATPGANQLIDLYQTYVALASDLRERKNALGIKPGIEAEVVLDKSAVGLYDDKGNGIQNGTYASLYRATMGNGADIDKLAEQSDASTRRVQIGGTVAGAGAVGGAVGNVLINKDSVDSDSSVLQQAAGLFLGK